VEDIQRTLPPLAGVLHAAAVFDDKLIGNLDAQSIQSVLNAKLLGAWHLHQATLSLTSLKHFVLYSSVTTAIGNRGKPTMWLPTPAWKAWWQCADAWACLRLPLRGADCRCWLPESPSGGKGRTGAAFG
jgi:hypothetical protein